MALKEEVKSTWDKRYFQKRFGYREYVSKTTLVFPEVTALGAALLEIAAGTVNGNFLYVFGTMARAKINPASPTFAAYGTVNWPANCYAREVKVSCDQDAFVGLISVNPEYLKQAVVQAYTNVTPTASQLIFEKDVFVPASAVIPQVGTIPNLIALHPTLGYAMVFRADTVQGTLRVWCEGNVEGTE